MDLVIEVVANLLRIRGDDFHLCNSQFQSFQEPALSSIEGFNRFAPFKALRQFKVQGSRVQEKSNSIETSESQELIESGSLPLPGRAPR
jgi:hypothetical protein